MYPNSPLNQRRPQVASQEMAPKSLSVQGVGLLSTVYVLKSFNRFKQSNTTVERRDSYEHISQ